MDVRCSHCGAPIPVKPGETLVTCLFCRQATRVEAETPEPVVDPRAELARSLREVMRAQQAMQGNPYQAAASPGYPMPPAPRPGLAIVPMLGCGLVGVVAVTAAVFLKLQVFSIDPSAPPTGGVIDLSASASSVVPVRVTGSVSAGSLDSDCRGYFERAPTVVVRVREAAMVTLSTQRGSNDPTLGLRSPSGAAFCDDDSGDGTNARLTLTLGPGDYPVWVGTYHDGDASSLTVVVQRELTPGAAAPGTAIVAATGRHGSLTDAALGRLPPSGGYEVVPAAAGHIVTEGVSGGMLDATGLGPCRGYIPAAPHVSYRLTDANMLTIRTSNAAHADLTLVVRGSDGRIRCDDDSGDGNDAMITDTFVPGRVDVWVGVFDESTRVPFALTADHEQPPTGPLEHGLAYASAPTLGVVDAATASTGWVQHGTTTGRVEASAIGSRCRGQLPLVPTVALNVPVATPLVVGTRARTDLVMAIRHPDGTWTCDDDSDGNQPRITEEFAPGDHRVFVGPFSRGEAVPFELRVAGPDAPAASDASPPPPGRARTRRVHKGVSDPGSSGR